MKLLLSCLTVCLVLSAGASAEEAVTEETISVDVSSGDPIEIITINGDIITEEWDSDQVMILYTITCDTEEELDFISVDCNTSNGILCEVDYDEDWGDSHSGSVDFAVNIPSDIDLEFEYVSVNGDVIVIGGYGKALLEVVNGDIIAESFDGELSVHAVNGDIDISESPGIRVAELVNGNIECIIDVLEDDLELAAVNGRIILDLRADAEVEIETISGTITVDDIFNAHISEEIVGSSTEFGEGEYCIEITTVSGDISIEE